MKEVQRPGGVTRSRLWRPQMLRDRTEENRTSTWLELFFDLCFVVAVAALARGLHDDPTLGGALRFLGLFVPVWWAWMGFTWFATAFDNDDVLYRVTMLAAMLCILWLAASVESVAGGDSSGFVLAYAGLRLLLVGLFVRARRYASTVRGLCNVYIVGNAFGIVLWLVSLIVPEPIRYGIWAVALAVEIITPIFAVQALSDTRISFHGEHIAERYGLFTLIVLGESVLAVTSGSAGTDWAPAAVLTAVAGFVAAVCIWWLYFDHVRSSGIELGPRPAFYWGYGHYAVYAGIAAFGVGVLLAIEAAAPQYALAAGAPASEGYGLGARTVLAGGVVLFLLGIAFVDRINEGTRNDRVLIARLAAVALLVPITAFGSLLSPLTFTVTVCLALLALALYETLTEDPPE